MSYHRMKGYMGGANEMCPGSQHSEKDAVEFFQRCVNIMLAAGYEAKHLLLRVDSGHHAADFIRKAQEPGIRFLIKHNLRRENEMPLLNSLCSYETPEHPLSGKTIYRGIRADRKPVGFADFNGLLVVEGVERNSLANEQSLVFPEIELDCWWTNLPFYIKDCVAFGTSRIQDFQKTAKLSL